MTKMTRQLPMMSAMMRVVSIVVTAISADSDMTEGCQCQSRDLPNFKNNNIWFINIWPLVASSTDIF